jgi:hypothetical protein
MAPRPTEDSRARAGLDSESSPEEAVTALWVVPREGGGGGRGAGGRRGGPDPAARREEPEERAACYRHIADRGVHEAARGWRAGAEAGHFRWCGEERARVTIGRVREEMGERNDRGTERPSRRAELSTRSSRERVTARFPGRRWGWRSARADVS